MKRIRLAILVCMILIGGAVLASLFFNLHGRKEIKEPEPIPNETAVDAKMYLEKIRFVEDKQGRKTWELEAKSIEQHEDQDIVDLNDVKVTVYTKEGRRFVISGDRARVNQQSKDAKLTGNVTLITNDGYRLRTKSVAYHHQEKQIDTSDPVEIDGEEFRVQGQGLFVDMEARTFKILGRVNSQWRKGAKG
jgi:LPS export ABC transporter protein LptC